MATEEDYRARIKSTLIPCVEQLASCGSSYEIWKPLNHGLLMRTRSNRPFVRIAALLAVQALFDKLAEEFLVLLPDTIPFLAELMEDEDVAMESLVKQLVQRIEELSGENLDQYLS